MEMKVNSQLIRAEREKRAWSQEHLASAAGLGLRTVQRIEARGVASYESVRALAAILELEPSDLTLEVATAPSPQEQEVPDGHAHDDRTPGKLKGGVPALVLAGGVLGGTGATILASDLLWWTGALMLGAAIVLARVLDNRIRSAGRQGILRAVYLGTTCFLALTVVAYADPEWVAMMIPVLGGASVTVLHKPLHKPLGCLLGRRRSPANA